MRAHAIDLHALIGVDVGREREDLRILAGARAREQLLHHGQGACVMLDHTFEEEPIELGALASARRAISSAVSMPGISVAPCA